ncbi:MAG: response regulator, partial [Burkholderiaceae bacterium]|nr:response regulator [Burkholderiaceae bacterium]
LHAMTQAALAERTAERDTLARIVETTDAEIQVVDADYRFLAINSSCARAYARIFGVSPVVGDSLLDVLARLPDAQRDAALALWRRALAGESFKLVHDWGEGAMRTAFEMSFEVLRAPDGTQTGAFLTGNDISERVRGEAALAATLEALRHAQKMEAVGQLTGGIAHDFNNLLMAIGGSLQTLQVHLDRGAPPGDLRRYVEMGESAVQRAASLTHRLLAFSRRQTLDPRPTDVNALVHGMTELILRSVGPDVQLRIDAAPDAWPTRIDAPQLENALLNLCINARDAMAPGGGTLCITTASVEVRADEAQRLTLPAGDYVRLSVADTGRGIAPDDMSRIFEPFYTTKPQGQGTGLGLSMVYGFVQQSGGQVDVLSAPGAGTTMHLYLPRHHGAAVADVSASAPQPLPSGGGQTVLLIDDEEMLRVMLADVLEEAGYRVLTARDGAEGLQRLKDERQRVDLLITDVGLPGGMNGRQVADAARRHTPGLPVLFITGYAENAAVGNGLMEPGMAVMTKPFPVAALAVRVKGMLASV